MAKTEKIFLVVEDDKIQATVETLNDAKYNAWDGCEIFEVVSVHAVSSETVLTKTPLKDQL